MDLDLREWLLTNGLGSFASGTLSDAHSRTYHGWLFAALEPPSQRRLLLSHLDAQLEINSQCWDLGTHFWVSGTIEPTGHRWLNSVTVDPVPTWVWQREGWQLQRRLLMPYGWSGSNGTGFNQTEENLNQGESTLSLSHQLLIEYAYQGAAPAVLRLRPLIADRDFHHQQVATADLSFAQWVEAGQVLLQAQRPNWQGTCWQLSWSRGDYQPNGLWYWGYRYPEETRRGLGDREDLFNPGVLRVTLQPGDRLVLSAQVRLPQSKAASHPEEHTFAQALQAEQDRLKQTYAPVFAPIEPSPIAKALVKAADQLIVYRSSTQTPTVIAGYPWFNDWGRDTLIALPGLALTTRRWDLAKGLLHTFGQVCQQGLIPNAFPDAGNQPFYNSLDASLWWIETLGLYLEASQDWDFLVTQYPIVRRIYKGLMAGTWYNIRVDAADGLVTWESPQVALTWMDAVVDGEPVTPRQGKPIEINALWYAALCWTKQWAEYLQTLPPERNPSSVNLASQVRRLAEQIAQVEKSLQKFWHPERQYLYDTIAPDDYPDASIRPNAVIALSLSHCGFSSQVGRSVLQVARDRLLTPYGLRSLDPADRRYLGRYEGGIWQRDRAYHQGTVWPWLLGPFWRSWQRFYPDVPVPFDWQPLLTHLEQQACLGSISELFDGDRPHLPRGAIAQAWSIAEILRHGGFELGRSSEV